MRRDLRTALSGIYGEAEVVRSLSTAVLGWPVCLQKALMSDGGGAQMEACMWDDRRVRHSCLYCCWSIHQPQRRAKL